MNINGIRIYFFLACISLTTCKSRNGVNESSGPGEPQIQDSLKILYVGTYTEKQDSVGDLSTGIYVYELNLHTGQLSYVSSSPHTENPSYLAAGLDNKILYSVNETGSTEKPGGRLSAFRIVASGRQLEFINSVSSRGNYPCYISIDNTGKWVMCANYGSGNVAVFPVSGSGSLEEASHVHQHTGKGTSVRQDGPHAHFIQQNPSTGFVYSCDLGVDTLYIYNLDTFTGKLQLTGQNYATNRGAGPRHLVFHPFMNRAYEVNELNGTIETMVVDSLTGGLSRIQSISTLEPGMKTEASCADIHITPSGKFLYASNRGSINNLAIYRVDLQTGRLTLTGHHPVNGKTPRNFVIDPTGKYLLVANQNTGNVVTFKIDQETGQLLDTGMESKIPSPVCLKFLN